MAEAQQRSPRRRGHELEHLLPVFVWHCFEDFPEELDCWVVLLVIPQDIDAAVHRVAAEVVDVNLDCVSADKAL